MLSGIQQIVIAFLCIASVCGVAYLITGYTDHIHVFKLITLAISFALLGYMVITVPFFWMDCFSVMKAAITEFIIIAGVCVFTFIRNRKNHKKQFGNLDRSIRKVLIPIGIAGLAFAMSLSHFGFFGMGQDQGVYQVKAINLMYGKTERVYKFEEYDKLGTEEEKAEYLGWIHGRLEGLYTTELRGESDEILTWLTGDPSDYEASDSIFHGIPTYPALLALWGMVFGLKNMAGVQTLVHVLTALIIWYISENLKLKKAASILACSIFLFSPEVLWVAKSTLTEGPLALIISLFILLLTADETDKRWNSAWMVVAFSVLHVTIYVMITMFLMVYYILYLKTKQKQYLRASIISCIGFIFGYTFMVYVSPSYTFGNTGLLCKGPITIYNVYYVLMAAALIGILFSVALRMIRVGKRFGEVFYKKITPWICRCFIVVMLFMATKSIVDLNRRTNDLMSVISKSGIYNMLWMTGIIVLIVVIIALMIRPQLLLKNEAGLGILLMFFYAVLLFCCIFKNNIDYCYYYGRYMVPYIPIVCVVSGFIWNHFSDKKIVAGGLCGVLFVLPFDMTLIKQKDDTRAGYETVHKFAEAVDPNNSAVIYEYDKARIFSLPIKAMTGSDCYFLTYGDVNEQAEKLSEQYEHIYCLTDSLGWEESVSADETVWMDDNESYRLRFCPFPYEMKYKETRYTLYEYSAR